MEARSRWSFLSRDRHVSQEQPMMGTPVEVPQPRTVTIMAASLTHPLYARYFSNHMKHALLTGASGFVGGELAGLLLESGYKVRALVRSHSPTEHLKGVELVRGSLQDAASLEKALQGITHVFHVAGVTNAASEAIFLTHNALGTATLAEAALKLTRQKQLNLSKFVLISSLAASGPSVPGGNRRESDRPEPVSAYGRSKLEGEKRLLAYAHSLPIAIVRPPMVYGPRDTQFLFLVKTVARRLAPRLPRSTTSPTKFYSTVHVKDLCHGILLAAEHPGPSGEIYFVCGDDVVSDREIFEVMSQSLQVRTMSVPIPRVFLQAAAFGSECLRRVTGRPQAISRDRLNEILPDAWTCTNQKAKDQLGFKPQHTFREGMPEIIDWYRSSGWIR